MKLWIALLSALLTLVLAQTSIAREVDGTKIKPFKAGEKAIADDVNNNFKELRGAINDNFTVIKTHKNTIGAHGGSGSGAGGDGSAGALTIGGGDWVTPVTGGTPIPTNLNYTSCLIGDKATATNQLELKVPSGITIRCQDGFTLNANTTITVGKGFGKGVARVPASNGEHSQIGDSFGNYPYIHGYGGKGLRRIVAASLIDSLPIGGAGYSSGGSFRIVSSGPIIINGKIVSNGKKGSLTYPQITYGGGAGGIVALKSLSNIDIAGSIEANGANGGRQSDGGGGGGIVVLVSPTIVGSANVTVTAGLAAIQVSQGTDTALADGGRACGGDGGNANGTPFGITKPTDGYVIEIIK